MCASEWGKKRDVRARVGEKEGEEVTYLAKLASPQHTQHTRRRKGVKVPLPFSWHLSSSAVPKMHLSRPISPFYPISNSNVLPSPAGAAFIIIISSFLSHFTKSASVTLG